MGTLGAIYCQHCEAEAPETRTYCPSCRRRMRSTALATKVAVAAGPAPEAEPLPSGAVAAPAGRVATPTPPPQETAFGWFDDDEPFEDTEADMVPSCEEPDSRPGLYRRNRNSLHALGFAIAYVIVAMTSSFVLLGVVPVMLSVQGFRRGEPMAPVAMGASAIAVAVSLTALSN